MNSKWDCRFMNIARMVSTWSKDPSTKCGALIVDKDRHPISMGYNGLPATMDDSDTILNNREQKYKHVIHAERNAILNCPSSVKDCVLYVTHPCCTSCADFVIKSGISRVVLAPGSTDFIARWNCHEAIDKLISEGIEVTILEGECCDEYDIV